MTSNNNLSYKDEKKVYYCLRGVWRNFVEPEDIPDTMAKIILYNGYGRVPIEVTKRYLELSNIPYEEKKATDDFSWHNEVELYVDGKLYNFDIDNDVKIRSDPTLIRALEEIGSNYSGYPSNLFIALIPKGTKYRICEYEGNESIELHNPNNWLTA